MVSSPLAKWGDQAMESRNQRTSQAEMLQFYAMFHLRWAMRHQRRVPLPISRLHPRTIPSSVVWPYFASCATSSNPLTADGDRRPTFQVRPTMEHHAPCSPPCSPGGKTCQACCVISPKENNKLLPGHCHTKPAAKQSGCHIVPKGVFACICAPSPHLPQPEWEVWHSGMAHHIPSRDAKEWFINAWKHPQNR